MTNARHHGCEIDEGNCELSLGSTEADNDYYDRNEKYVLGREGTGTLEVQQRRKRYFVKKKEVDKSENKHVDDIKEACSGTEEGQKLGAIKGKLDTKVVKSARSYKDTRKKSKKSLVGGGMFQIFKPSSLPPSYLAFPLKLIFRYAFAQLVSFAISSL